MTLRMPARESSSKERRLIVVMPALTSSLIKSSSTPFSSSKKRRSGEITFTMAGMMDKRLNNDARLRKNLRLFESAKVLLLRTIHNNLGLHHRPRKSDRSPARPPPGGPGGPAVPEQNGDRAGRGGGARPWNKASGPYSGP